MADNFKWLCHDYNLKPVEFLILNRECSALAWVNRAVEQRQKINSALIIASSASSVRCYLWSVCDTFGLGRETNQSINNNLSSLLGRVLWFVVNVCVCMCVSQFVQCSVHGDIIVIYRYFFLAHGSIGYHRLVCVVNLFNRSFHAKRDCCFFSSLCFLTSRKIFPTENARFMGLREYMWCSIVFCRRHLSLISFSAVVMYRYWK